MSDLIRRSDLLRILENNEPMNWRDTDEEITERACWHWFKKVVEDISPVDAVEVVRCRNCMHLFSIIFGSYCQLLGKQMDKDDYCSYGERRENNEID